MNDARQIRLFTSGEHACDTVQRVLALANDVDPLEWRDAIMHAQRVELNFPQFTDGRAYSQAWLVRRRLGFAGDLRATGDVLADQLIQMARTGFSSAVLKDGDVASDAPFRRDEDATGSL
jgi:uncharacterized protein (DUF934 family)